MALNRLADPTVTAVKLHGAFDLECRRVCRVPRGAGWGEPLLVCGNTIIYDLSAGKSCVTVKYLGGRGRGITDGPVKDCGVGDEAYCRIQNLFPEHHIFVV